MIKIDSKQQISIPSVLLGMFTFLIALSTFALCFGALEIPINDFFNVILFPEKLTESEKIYRYVILEIRLPRLITAIIVGAGLAASGVCTQALFRNPLADPALIGVSNGAAVGAVFVIVFSSTISVLIPIIIALPLFAFLAGLIATCVVMAISTYKGQSNIALLLLAGIAINAISASIIALLSYIANDDQLRDLTFWSMGSVAKAQWQELMVAAPIIIISCICLLRFKDVLNCLLMGENVAFHMGHDVKKN